MVRALTALLALAMTAGCASSQSYLLAEAPNEPEPLPGAKAPVDSLSKEEVVYNSDNKPAIKRTGLNSDPLNPNGSPARPMAWYQL